MGSKNYFRNPVFYNKRGEVKPGVMANIVATENKACSPVQQDTENRAKILKEIRERSEKGEELEVIVSEIEQRPEIKKQFRYLVKNGITDLASIFKNWYESAERNKEKLGKINGIR